MKYAAILFGLFVSFFAGVNTNQWVMSKKCLIQNARLSNTIQLDTGGSNCIVRNNIFLGG